MRFIAVDTETTGTDPRRDRIVELFMQEVNERLLPLRSWHQRLNPQVPIPETATAIHGIRDDGIEDLPTFQFVAPRVQRLLQDSTIIAYNGMRFDVPLLDQELRRAGEPGLRPNHPVIDPYLLFQEEAPRTLSGAVQHYLGRPHDGAHQAQADVEAMLDVLRVQWAKRHRTSPSLADLLHKDGRQWLDSGRRFYVQDGVVRLGFGQHRGEVAVGHPDYLRWMTQADFADETKQIAVELLEAAA